MPTADTVTIPGVELVKAGQWKASTGPVTITPADLTDAVTASHDAELGDGPIKLGHLGGIDAGDAAPAMGWVSNLRTVGDTLVGDLVDVPRKLAALMPKAFRRRSAELAFGVRTPAGKRYGMALTGLALLGVTPPAIRSLADVADLYGLAGDPELDADSRATVLLTGRPDDDDDALEAAVATIRRLAGDDPHVDAVLADVAEVTAGPDATIPPPRTSTGQNDRRTPAQEAPAMPITPERITELLGLEADADVEAAIEALKAQAATATPPPAPAVEEPAVEEPAGELVGASLSAATLEDLKAAGLVVVTAGVLDELKAGATAGAQAAAALAAQDVEATLDAAVADGRIAPAERDTFAGVLTSDLTAGKALLAGLAPRFPTAELGAAGTPASDADEAAWGAFEASLGIPAAGN